MDYFQVGYRIAFSLNDTYTRYEIKHIDFENTKLFLENPINGETHTLDYKDMKMTDYNKEIKAIYF